MRITNKYDLPQPIYDAAVKDPYTKEGSDFSVTELIESPRINVLKNAHTSDLERDCSDFTFSLLGRSLHSLLEKYGRRANDSSYIERRFHGVIGGFKVSGGMDLVARGSDLGSVILDWKLSTAKSASFVKIEWERQLNSYDYLYYLNEGVRADGLQICVVVRNWQKELAGVQASYPVAPIVKLQVKQWSLEEQKEYLEGRVALHAQARSAQLFGEELPLCTDDERWKRGAKWALTKEGGKRALSVHDREGDAEAAMKVAVEKAKKPAVFRIDHRPALPHRCIHYCEVSEFCSQWGKEREAINLKEPEIDDEIE